GQPRLREGAGVERCLQLVLWNEMQIIEEADAGPEGCRIRDHYRVRVRRRRGYRCPVNGQRTGQHTGRLWIVDSLERKHDVGRSKWHAVRPSDAVSQS